MDLESRVPMQEASAKASGRVMRDGCMLRGILGGDGDPNRRAQAGRIRSLVGFGDSPHGTGKGPSWWSRARGGSHMTSGFVLYGATGFVGEAIARLAVEQGLQPILAARNPIRLEELADELGAGFRAFDLGDPRGVEAALEAVDVVLNCAGPFIYTSGPMIEACLKTGTHYLDLSGEIPVYQALADRDEEAKARGIMLLPGSGFDVAATDCLAVHLKRRLPSATHLTLAFQTEGPAGLPPGTQRTFIEMIPYGNRVRRNGELERPTDDPKVRLIDFGKGPVRGIRLGWGDVFMAYYSTGIPNIEDYAAFPKAVIRQMAVAEYLRPLFKLAPIRGLLKRGVTPGPTPEARARSRMHVWGEVEDEGGRKAVSRLHGPEGGVNWTAQAALAAVRRVHAGNAPAGFQTPARAYGAEFVMACEGVSREDLP
jgi:short subunit dehydrogenase-like uncharacterized protein